MIKRQNKSIYGKSHSSLRRWARHKPALPALIAIQIAELAEDLKQWFSFLNPDKHAVADLSFDRDDISQAPPCSVEEWLSLYRNRRRVISVTMHKLFNHIPDIELITGQLMSFISSGPVVAGDMGQVKSSTQAFIGKEQLSSISTFFEKQLAARIADFEESLQSQPCSDADHATMLDFWRTVPEVQFFFRVWVPCLFDKGFSLSSACGKRVILTGIPARMR